MTPTHSSGPRVVPAGDPTAIALATDCLAAGGVVAVPTDTVYGIAASLAVPSALRRVFEIKGRSAAKSLPVLVASFEHVSKIAAGESENLLELARVHWPGPLTVVLQARPDLPTEVVALDAAGHRTVGVRVPDHTRTREVIAAAGGALAVTSANRSGERESRSAAEVVAACPSVDLVLDGGPSPGGLPSSVVAASAGTLQMLRVGAVPAEVLAEQWEEVTSRS